VQQGFGGISMVFLAALRYHKKGQKATVHGLFRVVQEALL